MSEINADDNDRQFRGFKGLILRQTDKAVQFAGAEGGMKPFWVPRSQLGRIWYADGGDSYESMAEKAFHVLDKAVSSLGGDRSVNFHDGAINATVRLLGGWQKCCDQPREEFEKWYRKDFIKTYVGVCRNGASEELRRYHGGRIEQHNAKYIGRTLRSGITYQPGMFGSDVEAVSIDYVPALPAPEPTKRLADGTHEEIKVELKLIGKE